MSTTEYFHIKFSRPLTTARLSRFFDLLVEEGFRFLVFSKKTDKKSYKKSRAHCYRYNKPNKYNLPLNDLADLLYKEGGVTIVECKDLYLEVEYNTKDKDQIKFNLPVSRMKTLEKNYEVVKVLINICRKMHGKSIKYGMTEDMNQDYTIYPEDFEKAKKSLRLFQSVKQYNSKEYSTKKTNRFSKFNEPWRIGVIILGVALIARAFSVPHPNSLLWILLISAVIFIVIFKLLNNRTRSTKQS